MSPRGSYLLSPLGHSHRGLSYNAYPVLIIGERFKMRNSKVVYLNSKVAMQWTDNFDDAGFRTTHGIEFKIPVDARLNGL